ncbi:proteasome assembly chaperone family protein [Promicromonospora thailandica]|uniref:PAC2 family protein n=1 Tax=Promicromonospora thailandica TaxID=765201 RepID=A0A9X2JUX9_9MICO|nr:PAC2 family protein [Promicromonospora thailandica]MCP2263972.1 PAC2 family protein [Promicromonospora thailandica]BFF17698.1 PAC2 family protein [Promicromonospora thailandica]
MLDPQGIYDVDEAAVGRALGRSVPGSTDGPVLLHAVRGFVDAGSAGDIAVEHLIDQFRVERLVTFDVDQLLDYRSKRATMLFDSDRWADYQAPYLAVDHLTDAEGTGFLLLHGAEPDLQWERVVAALIQLVERFNVSLVVGLQGIPMGLPHTRPLSLTAHATRPALVDDYTSWFGSVKVPGSLAALFEYRLGEVGHDALGFTVHVPHYLAQSQYPPATVVALQHTERATGLDLAIGALEEAATDAKIEVEKQVAESAEVAAVVKALEEQYDAFARSIGRPSLLAETTPIPSADELGAEFERFLAQQNGD